MYLNPFPSQLLYERARMIISASYKTDIPAFYGAWFENRLREGFCRTVNPYGGPVQTVALTPQDVDGFVFWTRNCEPFLDVLARVRPLYPFVVQYTVTGYPRLLETSVAATDRAVMLVRRLSQDYGARAVVWRYDPLVHSSLTPPAWHEANFAALAASLEGAVDEVVVSWAHVYRKTTRNMNAAAKAGFTWSDPPDEDKRAFLGRLAAIAARHGMTLSLCGQAELLVPGVEVARCIDVARLSDVAARPITALRKAHRSCACVQSRDIGAYDSCPHGCAYCYAVSSRSAAKRAFAAHDSASPFLFPPSR